MWTIHTVCDDHSKLAGNPGQKYICFCSDVITRPAPGNTHIDFKVVDCPFHNRPDFIKGFPFVRIPLDSRKDAEIHVFVGIGGPALLSGATRFRTVADPLSFLPCEPWGSPIYHGQHVLFHDNVRGTSYLKRGLSDKWDSHKDCNQLYQGCFRSGYYRESVPWKNGIHF